MKKTIKTVVGITAIILIAALAVILTTNKNIWNQTKEFKASEIILIQVELQDWTVRFGKTQGEQIIITASGKKQAEAEPPVEISRQDGRLIINQKKEIRDFLSNFTLGREQKVEILIPETWTQTIQINTENGDIYLDQADWNKLTAETKSGEVIGKNLKWSKETNITTRSGDIDLKYSNTPENTTLEAATEKQEITVSLPGLEPPKTPKEYTATTGTGANHLKIKTHTGYIRIH